MRIRNPFARRRDDKGKKARPCGVDTEIWRLMSAEYERRVKEIRKNLEEMR
ncbi:MAG: hypothetical protein LKI88_00665 [Bifidobacterium sp.]|jgi:hypothetical protein|nr:hypothetical protein [Bifidobacterium sp.]MCI1864442.1 hypothetical protein [Bifidobacterium sp.]